MFKSHLTFVLARENSGPVFSNGALILKPYVKCFLLIIVNSLCPGHEISSLAFEFIHLLVICIDLGKKFLVTAECKIVHPATRQKPRSDLRT